MGLQGNSGGVVVQICGANRSVFGVYDGGFDAIEGEEVGYSFGCGVLGLLVVFM